MGPIGRVCPTDVINERIKPRKATLIFPFCIRKINFNKARSYVSPISYKENGKLKLLSAA